MIIRPKIRGFICTTAHPAGCKAEVEREISYVKSQGPIGDGPRNALIVGSSMGYGLASRIAAAFGSRAGTLGVCLERPASAKRTATAGWYNTAAFHVAARSQGLYAETINGDAFAEGLKGEVAERIRRDLGTVDLVVYSLAAPRRTLPDGTVVHSALKPIGSAYHNKTLDVASGEVGEVTLGPADAHEIADTEKVMGGEDWEQWIEALEETGTLAPNATTVAYSYIGPELTFAIYRHGTIGRAKNHLEATAHRLDEHLRKAGGRALIAVNKAVVTQSSSAIPVVPLYISLLFRVMKDRHLHEGCIEQMRRLFGERLYGGAELEFDSEGRVRMDDLEMRSDVQEAVEKRWAIVNTENLESLADMEGYRQDFLRLFGFDMPAVDYSADIDPEVTL